MFVKNDDEFNEDVYSAEADDEINSDVMDEDNLNDQNLKYETVIFLKVTVE